MKLSIRSISAAFAVAGMMTLAACGGGGGGTSTGGHYLTHAELAQEFVRRVNLEIQGFDLSIVKINTLQYDYIVVYDHDFGTYDAYFIGGYSPGTNLPNYINQHESMFYYGLIPEYGNTYYDQRSGTRFEKSAGSSKNLAKLQALKEQLVISRAAAKMRATYGLSVEKSEDAARFAYKMQTTPAGTYNVADYDAFAKELTGSTITEFQEDFKAGNLVDLTQRINTAGEVSGMGVEGVNKLIGDMFVGQ